MSRQIDLSKPLSEEDAQWLRDRSWGHMIPSDQAETGVVLDQSASDEDRLAQVPNTGTATGVPTEDHKKREPEYTQADYESWKVDDLKAEIADRNSAREDEATHISDEGKKADLIAALVADDEAQADEPTE
jgi:hypothetical protein